MADLVPSDRLITDEQFAYLRSVDSPTIANAVELFEVHDRTEGFIGGAVKSLFPEMGVMVGYALTVTMDNQPGPVAGREGYWAMWDALAAMPTPSVLVVQDVSGQPTRCAYAGEIMATLSQKLGAVGMVTDGGFRDLDEVRAIGMHYYAGSAVVAHGNFSIVDVGVPITLDGQRIETGDILHGDANGIVVVPSSTVPGMPEAVKNIRDREGATLEFLRSGEFTYDEFKRRSGY